MRNNLVKFMKLVSVGSGCGTQVPLSTHPRAFWISKRIHPPRAKVHGKRTVKTALKDTFYGLTIWKILTEYWFSPALIDVICRSL